MSILSSDDPFLDALLAEGDSHNAPDSVPDKRIPGGQMRGQISPAIQQEVVDRAVPDYLRSAIAQALLKRTGRDAVPLPRAASYAQFKNSRYRSDTGSYPRLSKYLGSIAWRVVNDLMKAGAPKPDRVDFAAALHEHLTETFADRIRLSSSASVQLNDFERWATIGSSKAVAMASARADAALKKWDARFHEIQAERGRVGGRRSKRVPSWTEAELDRVVGTIGWTVDEHVRLFRAKFSESTIKRMRSAARTRIAAQPDIPAEPTRAKRLEDEGTSQPTASAERRAAQRWHRERRELGPGAVAETVPLWALRAAEREEAERTAAAFTERIRQPSRYVPEDFGDLLNA